MFGNNFIGGVPRAGLNLPRILNGLSKTLGVVNRAIPLYRQAKPMIEKGRTMFKTIAEINKSSSPAPKPASIKKDSLKIVKESSNKPVFFQ